MKLSHLLVLVSATALFAWTRPAAVPNDPRGELELRHDLLSLNDIKPGSSLTEVRIRLGRPDKVERLPEASSIWTYQDHLNLTAVYLSKGHVVAVSGVGPKAGLINYKLLCRAQVRALFGPPHQETEDAYTYQAGPRVVTFVFWGERLAKTTLAEAP